MAFARRHVVDGEDRMVVALAREAVARAAPDELPLVEATAQAYFAAPRRFREAQRSDDMLGFGVESAGEVLTPVALAVAAQALKFAAAQAGTAVREELGGVFRAWVRRLLHRLRHRTDEAPAPVVHNLDAEQLHAVHELAYSRAVALGTPVAKATVIADAIVAGLVLRTTSS